MGKYPESRFLPAYSDWHVQQLSNRCYMTDLDKVIVSGAKDDLSRLWVEADEDFHSVAVIDIKEPNAEISYTQGKIYDEIESGLGPKPVYIVCPDFANMQINQRRLIKGRPYVKLDHFLVQRWRTKEKKHFTLAEYKRFIEQLRGRF